MLVLAHRGEQSGSMQFECASRTDVGLRRKINEDSILSAPERGLWAVADGMGGHQAGEVASGAVTEALRRLPNARNADELAAQATEALQRVNGELIALARASERKKGAVIGTTVVGLAIADGAFRCFWMGDSRAYLLRGGEIRRLTRDHSVVQKLVDAGMLDPEDAETHEDANLITRAVGADEEAEVDVVSGEAMPGDQFLLASDGLTRLVRDDELAFQLQRQAPAEAAEALIDMVLDRGAPDNVSLIIIKLL